MFKLQEWYFYQVVQYSTFDFECAHRVLIKKKYAMNIESECRKTFAGMRRKNLLPFYIKTTYFLHCFQYR